MATFAVLLANLVAAEFVPKVTYTTRKYIVRDILYFEDSSNVVSLRALSLEMSYDDGETWKDMGFENFSPDNLIFDPKKLDRAVVFGSKHTHYVTNDKGRKWTSFTPRPIYPDENKGSRTSSVLFKDKYVLIATKYCNLDQYMLDCETVFYLSKDSLETDPKQLSIDAKHCIFTDFGPEPTLVCSRDSYNAFGHVVSSKLVKSSDFFKTEEVIDHPDFKSGRIIDVRMDLPFLVVVVQKDRFSDKSLVSLVISKDGDSFATADLGFNMEYGAIRFLPADPESLFLSVMRANSRHAMPRGTIYASDSTGLRFRKVLENVDLGSSSKLEYVNGVWLARIIDVENSIQDPLEDPTKVFFLRKASSRISIDNGLTWQKLRVNNDNSCKVEDGCSLHLLNYDSIEDKGKYMTGPTPGILVGFGSTGDSVEFLEKTNTYISRDGGVSWDFLFLGPGIHAFGDQGNVIIHFPFPGRFKEPGNILRFSLDQGKTWSDFKLPANAYPMELITANDGSKAKFVMSGMSGNGDALLGVLFALDFSDAFNGKKCTESDMEKIYVRVSPDDGNPTCVYGTKQSFSRRKQDSQCLVQASFDQDIKASEEKCKCTELDYECSPYFKLSDKGACVPDPAKISELCKTQSKNVVKLPDKQLVPGNKCEEGTNYVADTEFKCSEFKDIKNENQIKSGLFKLDGALAQYSYVSPGGEFADNLIIKTTDGLVHASNDGGSSFVRVPFPEAVLGFYIGPSNGRVIMITDSDTFYASDNGANSFVKFTAPGRPASNARIISFHPLVSSRFIWISGSCGDGSMTGCTAYYTDDFGYTFEKLIDNALSCDFVSHTFGLTVDELIYCTVVDENGKKKLASSTNFFKDQSQNYLLDNIVAYALTESFVVVATINEDQSTLNAKVTADGVTFADADFPSDFKVEANTAFTILDSGAHSIFMHVTTNSEAGHEKGSILKSNSNGTYYVLSLPDVNRDHSGYVDFDRLQLLEGVLIANTVSENNGEKERKTVISFNDGSEWRYIPPPAVDSDGNDVKCKGQSLEKCSLNLHGFTERPDYRDTFSSGSAVGILIGIGNIGEKLGLISSPDDNAAYISVDGGLSWKEIRKGVYHWEFGDQGSILVLVDAAKATNEVIYSYDEGMTWNTYKFTENPVRVLDLATVPSDTALKFVIFTGSNDGTQVFSIDFSLYFPRQCQLDLENPDNDDYEFWSPMHPDSAEGCLFGHESKFLRRANGHTDCFIGSAPLQEGFKVTKNCSCTRSDYECDFNYFRDTDGTCKLVSGLSAADRMSEMCSKPGTFEYFEPTGYRKIPLSTCVGGKQFDALKARACPGHEKEFNEAHGRDVGSGKLFILIFIPLVVFFGTIFFVYDRGIRRNGGFLRLGQIRLDDEDSFNPIEENSVDVAVNRTVRGAIVLVAGTYAVLKTIRRIDRAMFDKIASVLLGYRPGERNYVRVPDEEDELFGTFDENYEDELDDAAEVNFNVDEDPEEFTEFTDQPAEVDEGLFDIEEDQPDEVSASPEERSTDQ